MKKEYIKPDMKVVELQHMTQLLVGSNTLTGTSTTGLDDDLDIDGEEVGTGFWGR